jgi:hypothetical protein
METHSQDPVQELKAERVQEEMTLDLFEILPEEPFRISLKAERVQEPSSLLAPVSLAYEISFNQMRAVTVELNEPQIVVNLFADGGLEAA